MSCVIKDTCIKYFITVLGISVCSQNSLSNCQLALSVETVWREAAEYVFEGNRCCSIGFGYCCGVTIAKYCFIGGSICKRSNNLRNSVFCTLCNVVGLSCLNIL